MMGLEEIAAKWGLPCAVMVYFLFRDHQRSKDDKADKKLDREAKLRLEKRITEIEDYQKGRLEKIAVESGKALTRVSETVEHMVEASDRVHTALLRRPCIAKDMAAMTREAS